MDFYERAAIVCRSIPVGRVASYGQIALLCGKPKHARQVGYALNKGKLGADIPAHRVVNGQGFLSGYLEEQFDLLEEYTPYPQIWAPYYTLHKLFAGLLDCYELLGNSLALKIAEDLGDWTCRRLSRLP